MVRLPPGDHLPPGQALYWQGVPIHEAVVGVPDDLHLVAHRVPQHDLRLRADGREDEVLEGAAGAVLEPLLVLGLLQVLQGLSGRPQQLFDALAARLPPAAAGHIVPAPVVEKATVMAERQLWRLKAQAFKNRPMRFDGEDDFLVVHAFVVASAPGDEVLVQQPGQGHGHVRVGGQRAEPQGFHQLNIQLPQLGHPFTWPDVRPVHVLSAVEEVICLHAHATPALQRCRKELSLVSLTKGDCSPGNRVVTTC
ncbi:hypothetical protein ACWEKU_12835 [Streptomyces californicus]